jgi:hypothetical protein
VAALRGRRICSDDRRKKMERVFIKEAVGVVQKDAVRT